MMAVLFVACGQADEDGGGGLTEGTPIGEPDITVTEDFTDTDDLTDTDVTTDTDVMTETEDITVTVDVTDTVDITDTEDITVTDDMTDTTDMEDEEMEDMDEMEDPVVVLASDLMDMEVANEMGEEIGFIAEILADDTGAIQYVVLDLSDDATTTTDTEEDAEPRTVAIAWDSFDVETGVEDDMIDDTEAITGTEEITGTDEVVDDETSVRLVLAGTASLDTAPEFDMEILDEEGYVLDDMTPEGEEDEIVVPLEYVDLLQVGAYEDFEVVGAADEDLGEAEELLIDLANGQIAYLVVDVGGFLGIAAKSVAVPWENLELATMMDGDNEVEEFRLDATEEMLEEAPEIDLDAWDPEFNLDWDLDLRGFWDDNSQ
jgi:sporulation protein YlmC with PRC-barrel domain